MCGIAGFVGDFSPSLLVKMTDSIAHRGMDSFGYKVMEEGRVQFGHRRLSIIDLSENGAQPMESHDGRFVTIFNGEIYNFHELADDLKSHGYHFNGHSDTAILAPLYAQYGQSMLLKLSGIFAFAIWDKKEKKLFCARDHAGTKPFYYSFTEQGFLFASELKALLFEKSVKKDLNADALFSYLTYLWCPGEGTMLQSVHKLLPGHFMEVTLDGKTHHIQPWYKEPLPEIDLRGKPIYDKHKTPEDLLHLLDEVVDAQMVSDVPVGTFLSGGVDSSAIAASMAHRDMRPFDAYCMTFLGKGMAEEGFSEDLAYATKVAKRYDNIQLHEVVVDENCLLDLPSMVYFLDEPQADPAPLYVRKISHLAKQMGTKVLMSGSGGDDVFSGYRRHQMAQVLSKGTLLPRSAQVFGAQFAAKLTSGALKRRLNKLAYILKAPLKESLIKSFHYTETETLISLLSADMKTLYLNRTADFLEKSLEKTEEQAPLNRLLHLEWHGFLPDHNLNYTDKLGMAEGVEIRVPLLDPKIFEFAKNLPLEQKVHRGTAKYIFKKSQESRLPHDVLYRSKAGFGAPIREWLTGNAYPLVEDVLLSDAFKNRGIFNPSAVEDLIADTLTGVKDGAYTLLSLIVIELWLRQFMDVPEPQELKYEAS